MNNKMEYVLIILVIIVVVVNVGYIFYSISKIVGAYNNIQEIEAKIAFVKIFSCKEMCNENNLSYHRATNRGLNICYCRFDDGSIDTFALKVNPEIFKEVFAEEIADGGEE